MCGYWPAEHPGGPDKGWEAPWVSGGEFNLQLQLKTDRFKVRLVLGQSVGLLCLRASVRVSVPQHSYTEGDLIEMMTIGDRKSCDPRMVKQFPQSHIVSDRVEIFNQTPALESEAHC